ncbi:hypothetical protein H010_09141 [Hydrogenophaga taeniospiralis CCUG 15921]|uniref:Uncharacterized protein n=1 Tax=Hydrogenophaga taeniospiralis CCUG 15921 TaxID=1281780 RepID=A0A9X4NQC5_9BURK|nr:hypothetical protein [Hydrogenophaga taeniospiralis]MDG5975412.1 hypothetical protein [Hydrogenophaga taeniospiralis CCUG 15921]
MLLLDARSRIINGLSVFPDHADPEQWYYMPTAPHLTTRRDSALGVDIPQFMLLGFRGDAGNGGFLNFDCNVGASQAQIDDLAREIANAENLRNAPRIAPIPLEGGTVRLMMLGKDSAAPAPTGTPATPAGPQFVLKMDHSANPSLYGDNQAAFSVQLDQDGFTVMQQVLDGEILPIAVVYSLEFLGLRPAYNIRLKVDWDRVQKHMDESFSASILVFSTEIGKAVDELIDKRAIVLESDTFVAEGDDTKGIIDRRDAALAQVRSMITEAFFNVSLPPWTPEKKPDWERAMDAVGRFATAQSAQAAGGPAAGLMPSFSYKRMDYTRMDKKALNVNFSERVAVKKHIHPQGHLQSLFKTLRDGRVPMDHFVKQVSLDNEWFKKRKLRVTARNDLAADDIASINVRAAYGDKPQNALLTPAALETKFEWFSQIDAGKPLRDVAMEYEVTFKNVDTTKRPARLKSPPWTVDIDNVEIVPRDLYSLITVPVMAENFPWERYSSVEVQLRYADDAHEIAQHDTLRLTKEAPSANWKMFVLDPDKTTFEVKKVFRAIDHRDVEHGWQACDETQVTVRNPFPTRRVVQVVPSVDWTQVQEAFVDFRYEDPANNVLVEESMSFTEGTSSKAFAVDLRNPALKSVFYRISLQYKDSRFVELPESMTNATRIAIKTDTKGHRIVTVRAPSAFERRHLRKATVSLRFEDFAGGLSFADEMVFENGQSSGEFEYDYLDPARMRFEYSVRWLFENGLNKVTDWTASDATELPLQIPN